MINHPTETAEHPSFLFGRLTWNSVPWHEPIVMVVTAVIVLITIFLIALVILL